MNVLLVSIAVLVALLVAAEVGLRLLLGFGNPLIYISDEEIGYLLAANQRTRRFGNRIEINNYSMRSAVVAKTRPDSTLRVLLLGDSIANGGWWTDQDQTISALIAAQLQQLVNSGPDSTSFERVEVLNASANSWGPRNELAYLKRFGTFDAQAVVLLLNTDDLFAPAPTSVPVGRDRNYPIRKPPLALIEAFNRVLPYKPPAEMAAVHAEPGDRVGFNLEAIGQIQTLANADGSQLVVAITPLLREIGDPTPRAYEVKARARFAEYTKERQIPHVDFLPLLNSSERPQRLYNDHIHLNVQGNQFVSEVIVRSLQPLLPLTPAPTPQVSQ